MQDNSNTIDNLTQSLSALADTVTEEMQDDLLRHVQETMPTPAPYARHYGSLALLPLIGQAPPQNEVEKESLAGTACDALEVASAYFRAEQRATHNPRLLALGQLLQLTARLIEDELGSKEGIHATL
jgi:hypothetical protein